ncbi:MAG: hypothetical protein JHC26_05895 [Thermofilum sp.]|jgi:hypothetical protein|uniref:hypothetical protein n=1 Tax=Thermofilum sp. TaxID=1961369 RepID=UPI0025889463|nr:hypothetical protein [Thermofilum sp.]MCI4408604.1 hypothetical protein [Thermofilum sp.]
MVLLRGATIAAMASGSMTPRSTLVVSGLQLVTKGNVTWAEKEAWLRNPPHTAVNPTLGQLEIRREFGRAAKNAKGTKGLQVVTRGRAAGKALPGAAKTIAETLTGHRMPHSLSPDQYPSKLRRTIHTLDELELMYQRKLGATAGP